VTKAKKETAGRDHHADCPQQVQRWPGGGQRPAKARPQRPQQQERGHQDQKPEEDHLTNAVAAREQFGVGIEQGEDNERRQHQGWTLHVVPSPSGREIGRQRGGVKRGFPCPAG